MYERFLTFGSMEYINAVFSLVFNVVVLESVGYFLSSSLECVNKHIVEVERFECFVSQQRCTGSDADKFLAV